MTYFKKSGYIHELTREAKALTFKTEVTISADVIENIIVSSLEGASSYWCGLDNTAPEWINEPEDLPSSQFATQLILEGKTIKLYDIEDTSEEWQLDISKLLGGISKAIREGYDIESDVDEVLQLALFGELVYG